MVQPDQLLRPLDHLAELPAPLIRLLDASAGGAAPPPQAALDLAGDEALGATLAERVRRNAPDRPVDTPARIVDALGADAVARAALSAAAMEAFGPPAGALDREEFWKHSLAVAVAAELAAGQVEDPPDGGLAFACGLLH
ncbi:MAG: HDOD domain-containing protein, partial [Planctomycetota bacterium]